MRPPPLSLVGIAVATVAALAPFLGRAVHVDDPLTLWNAEHLLDASSLVGLFDFYGFDVNWYGYVQPMHEVNQNPPALAYYYAAVAAIAGSGERWLHAAALLPAVACLAAIHALARRVGASGALAAGFALATPAFFVSSTTLMTDVPMLALFVWSLVVWIDGLDRSSPRHLVCATLLALLAALTKYFGLALVPLLAAIALLRRPASQTTGPHPAAWLGALAIPLAGIALYEAWAQHLYGHGLLAGAVDYAARTATDVSGPFRRIVRILVYAGGCVLPLLFFLPTLRGSALHASAIGAALGAATALAADATGPFRLHATVFAAASGSMLGLVATELVRRRDPERVWIGLWIAGTLVFAGGLNWTVSARSVLPLVPPLALLLARALGEPVALSTPRRVAAVGAWLGGVGLSALLAHADAAVANAQRGAAADIYARAPAVGVAFQGRWGFHYYMERAGARALDFAAGRLEAGELYVSQLATSNMRSLPTDWVEHLATARAEPRAWATTHEARTASFYSSVWAPLPWVLREPKPIDFLLLRVRGDIDFAELERQQGRERR